MRVVVRGSEKTTAIALQSFFPCVNGQLTSRRQDLQAEHSMAAYLWVAFGGALGSVGRFWLSGLVARHAGETFPWGTLVVNVTGSFVIGLFGTITGPEGRLLVPPWFRQPFFMLGVCGGYTTFSSFSLQTLSLLEGGQWLYAAGNVLLSVLGCLVAVWAGHVIGLRLNA
jgi:CrcB protein